jgi:hypothetical protein
VGNDDGLMIAAGLNYPWLNSKHIKIASFEYLITSAPSASTWPPGAGTACAEGQEGTRKHENKPFYKA